MDKVMGEKTQRFSRISQASAPLLKRLYKLCDEHCRGDQPTILAPVYRINMSIDLQNAAFFLSRFTRTKS